jgi:hypothetical protein
MMIGSSRVTGKPEVISAGCNFRIADNSGVDGDKGV